jgi:drug/metabolite transporter (DMT)-like permease
VTAILGGLAAAAAWAASTLANSRSTKLIPPASALAGVMVVGAVITAPFALPSGVPDELRGAPLAWLVASAVANIVGLLFAYSALRVGKVGIVAPVNSTQGAVAALIAVLGGETLAAGAGLMLVLIAVGVALASLSSASGSADRREDGHAALLAGTAACLFGFGLYAVGRASADLPVAWVLFLPRLLGVVLLTLPLLVLGRLRMTRRALGFVLLAGVCEVVGLAAFSIGAREGIAVTAILSSQFAALAAVVAYYLFDERLRRVQVVGVAAIVVGVAVLTGLQA